LTIDPITRRLLSSASLYHKVRRRLYHRTATKKQVVAGRTGFYRDVWEEAAAQLGGTVTVLERALLEIRCGDVVLRTRTNLTSLDDQLTVAVADDKPLVYRLLAEHGLPVPRHLVCRADDLRGAWAFARSLGRPCVVKPARASGAIGVTTGVDARYDLARALAYGGAFGRELLVEEMVGGGIYRLLYFDGELLDAVRRDPPTVAGDGASPIERLIQTENERRLAGGIAAAQSLIKIDGELRHTLRHAGRTLQSVPAAGEVVLLKNVVNDNRREDNVSAAGALCPEVVRAGAAAAAAVGTRLAGVDIITPDPSRPLAEAGGVVIEVNQSPGYYYHYYKREGRVPVATLILERLIEAAS
jgi:cyanophycin synthetase